MTDEPQKFIWKHICDKPYSIQRLEGFLRKYEESSGLDWFLNCSDLAIALSTRQQIPYILEKIKQNLKPCPRFYEPTKHMTSYHMFRDFLVKRFTGGMSLRELKVALGNCRQNRFEDPRDYYQRLKRLVEGVVMLMRYSGEYSEEEMFAYRERMEDTKLELFTVGVAPAMFNFFKHHPPRNMISALTLACERRPIFNGLRAALPDYKKYRSTCGCTTLNGFNILDKEDYRGVWRRRL